MGQTILPNWKGKQINKHMYRVVLCATNNHAKCDFWKTPRAQRERAKSKTYEATKSLYVLPPFDPAFDRRVHNIYTVRREAWQERRREEEAVRKVVRQYRNKWKKEHNNGAKINRNNCIIEIVIIGETNYHEKKYSVKFYINLGLLLSIVPGALLLLVLLWDDSLIGFSHSTNMSNFV